MITLDACRGFAGYKGTIRFRVANDDIACIGNGRGLRLYVQKGPVWISHNRSIADVLVDAGDAFLVDRDGMTLVSLVGNEPAADVALTPSIRIAPPQAKRRTTGNRRLSRATGSYMDWGQDVREKVLPGGLSKTNALSGRDTGDKHATVPASHQCRRVTASMQRPHGDQAPPPDSMQRSTVLP
jgi:hypothetical protein